jgi:hypothetical protein
MKLLHPLRRHFARLALVCATALAVGLLCPLYSSAATGGPVTTELSPREEQRAAREEQRATREAERQARVKEHEAQRTAREAEQQARREKRSEERADRHATAPQIEGQPSGDAGHGCPLTLQASSTRITAGETVTLSGTLTCPTSTTATAAAQQVSLYERQPGAKAAQSAAPVQTVTAATDGSYEITSAALYATTILQVRVGRHHARVIVKVAPHITLTLSSPPATAQSSAADNTLHPQIRTKTTFSGTVSPVIEGARVALQVSYSAADEQWRTVAYGRVGAGGEYSIAHSFRMPGAASVRAVVHPRGRYVSGISEAVPYQASQPQNPQLTIGGSPDPLTYGQQVTISGTVAGAANQPVKLLAFTQKGGLSVVAEGTTEANGDYTFIEEPLENTYYDVTGANERSTTLFVGVAFTLSFQAPPATAQAGEQLTFSGTLTGAPEGQVVFLERGNASGLGFHVVASGTVAPTGYQIPYAFDRTGANVMRIRVPDNREHRGSASPPFTVTVMG